MRLESLIRFDCFVYLLQSSLVYFSTGIFVFYFNNLCLLPFKLRTKTTTD
nr:MAG TPA: hypothetical protein [Caudoviricetes sp.]